MNPDNPTTEEQEDIDLGRVPPDLGCNPITTGEQVAQQIWANSLSGASREVQFKAAVNAINAALTAEAPRLRHNLRDVCVERDIAQSAYAVSQQQLAAEREQTEVWKTENESRAILIGKIAKLVGYDNSDGFHSSPDILEIIKQLAAAKEEMRASHKPPKPVGEWTPWCIDKFYAAGRLQEQQLCDAINAAIAAEREKIAPVSRQAWESVTKVSEHNALLVDQLREQLAAERIHGRLERPDVQYVLRIEKERKQLEEQLAAAVEALKEIKRWCSEAGTMATTPHIIKVADAALAKIGEKP